MLRVAVLLLALLTVNVQQAFAAQIIARDGPVSVSAREDNWCGPTAKVEITAPDPAAFSERDPRLARMAGVLQTALSFECPVARAVDIWGTVGGKTVYRGSAAAAEGWRLRAGSASSNKISVGAGGIKSNADGLLPSYWKGPLVVEIETVRANRIDKRKVTIDGALYPQPDGRIRARFGDCEGQIAVLRQGQPVAGIPQLGQSERLFMVVRPVRPLTFPAGLQSLRPCESSVTPYLWLVVRANHDGSLYVRYSSHDRRDQGRRQMIVTTRTAGQLPPVMPAKPRRVSEARAATSSADYSAFGPLLLLGALFVGGSMLAGGGSGSSDGEGGRGRDEFADDMMRKQNDDYLRSVAPK